MPGSDGPEVTGPIGAAGVGEPEGDDARLVRAARGGDRGAIEEIWRRHRRWVAAVIVSYKPRDVDAEDLIQDVAATLVRRVGEVREGAALVGWLRTVAMNAARAAARGPERRLRRPWLRLVGGGGGGGESENAGMEAEAAGRDGAGAAAHLSEEAERVMELAMGLPDGYREPLLLKSLKGMSYREIGRVLDLPETTVETRIARARRMLRERAEASDVGGDVSAVSEVRR